MSVFRSLVRTTPVGRRQILEIDLDLGVVSMAPDNPLVALRNLNAPTMRALREGLAEAASDDDVAGLIVHVGTAPLTPTQSDELGDAIAAFGNHKPTIAFAESFGEMSTALLPYTLACAAREVWLAPTGELGLAGVTLTIDLLRGTLEKVGVQPQIGQRHEYKTAADRFMAAEVTSANREMMQAIADSVVGSAAHRIATRRGLDVEEVRGAIDRGTLTPADALAARLVDRIGYRDEVYAAARQGWNPQEQAELKYVHRRNVAAKTLERLAGRAKPAVAVVTVHGRIQQGRPRQGGQAAAGSDVVCQELRAAARDPQVKAVVLRVDSPGGSYVASDAIRREVLQVRAAGRPVVASMGDYAASGGYFVAMGADAIVANPTTLTGSIGVFGGKMVIAGLKSKVGIVSEDVASGPWAGMMSPSRPFTPEQWEALNRRLDEIYADFVAKAAHDRGMAVDVLEPIARGRVWTGADALDRGLVDHLGGMSLAIERACALAEVSPEAVQVRPAMPGGIVARLRPADSSDSPGASVVAVGGVLEPLSAILSEALGFAVPGVLSLPYRVTIR